MKKALLAVIVVVIIVAGSVAGVLIMGNRTVPMGNGEDLPAGSVGAAGGSVSGGDSHVSLQFPAGALSSERAITITGVGGSGMIPGTAFRFGPEGLAFAKPVVMSISYDPASLPQGTAASALSLAKWDGARWNCIQSSGANGTQHKVVGAVTGFSTYAVVVNATKVSITTPIYAIPGERTAVSFTLTAPLNEAVTYYRAMWSTNGAIGKVWAYDDQGNGMGGEFTYVDYFRNGSSVAHQTAYYIPENSAMPGQVDTISLEIRISFDFVPDDQIANVSFFSSGAAQGSVQITNGGLRMYPQTLTCLPGQEIPITPSLEHVPAGMEVLWNWRIESYRSNIREVGSLSGSTEVIMSDAPYILFYASQHEVAGNVIPITLTAMTRDAYGGGYHSVWSPVHGNITISTGPVSIEFDGLPQIDLWRENTADMTVNVTAGYQGTLHYVWNTTGDYGGFGPSWPSSLKTWESNSPWAYYYGNGLGEDGQADLVTVSVYAVFNGVSTLVGNASAVIEVYKPLTKYSLLDADGSTGWLGSGSNWYVGLQGHGPVNSYTVWFYARPGDTLRLYCQDPGYRSDWTNHDVYLWSGSSKRLLISGTDVQAGREWLVTVAL
jgi:hypothetical protein